MAKYIELDCLIDMIDERNRNTCNGKMSCIQMKRMVESIPAADVAPVGHGVWVKEIERTGNYSHCSECGCRCAGYIHLTINTAPTVGEKWIWRNRK